MLSIDLETYESSKIELKKEISKFVTEYRETNPSPGHRITTNRSLIKRILKAHRIKNENPKITTYEIAQRLITLYATDANKDSSQLLSKVTGDLEAAQKYIENAPFNQFKFKKT